MLVFLRRQAKPRQTQQFWLKVTQEVCGWTKWSKLPLWYLEPAGRESRWRFRPLFKGKTDRKATQGLSVSETSCTSRHITPPLFFLSTKDWCRQPAPCTLLPRPGAWAPVSFTGYFLQTCPPGTHNAGGWKTENSTKEGILFRHQPFALAKSEETMGRALIPSTLHLGFKNRSPDPCTKKRGQSFWGGENTGRAPTLPTGCSTWRTEIVETSPPVSRHKHSKMSSWSAGSVLKNYNYTAFSPVLTPF